MTTNKSDQPLRKTINCPACSSQSLVERELKNQISVDVCLVCRGTWLDGGEILRLTKDHQAVQQSLMALQWEHYQSSRQCPKCNCQMLEGEFLGATSTIDFCPSCEGLWFDSMELKETVNELMNSTLESHQILSPEFKSDSFSSLAKQEEVQGLPARIGAFSVSKTSRSEQQDTDDKNLKALRWRILLRYGLIVTVLCAILLYMFFSLESIGIQVVQPSMMILILAIMGGLIICPVTIVAYRKHYCSDCRRFSRKVISSKDDYHKSKWRSTYSYRIVTRCIICNKKSVVEGELPTS